MSPSQLILKPYNIDNRSYDASYVLITGNNQTYINNYTGSCNYYRTQITFKNINLNDIIPNYKQKKRFNIKLVKMEGQREYQANCLREIVDSQTNLCSNIYLSGLPFINGNNEVLLKTIKIPAFKNYYTALFQTISTIGGGTSRNYTFNGTNAATLELLDFLNQNVNQTGTYRFRMTGITLNGASAALDASIEGIVLQFTNYTVSGGGAIAFTNVVFDSTQTIVPSSPSPGTQRVVNFEFLPSGNFNYDYVVPIEENNNNSFTFNKPGNSIVTLNIETKDLLSNSLQPVAATTGIYPSYTYHFEIN